MKQYLDILLQMGLVVEIRNTHGLYKVRISDTTYYGRSIKEALKKAYDDNPK